MTEPLDELYLRWLYAQFVSTSRRSRSRSYWDLFRMMFKTEFVWFIPNDDNRIEDGKSLRYIFLDEHDLDVDDEWLSLGCSFLEMVAALTRRLSYETDISEKDWFWHLMSNLDLTPLNDRDFDIDKGEEIVNAVIWRTYAPDGRGGLFPLRGPLEDQRTVELWYQMSSYIYEQETV